MTDWINENLARSLGMNLGNLQGKWESAGKVVGDALSRAEDDVIRAFSLPDSKGGERNPAATELARRLGLQEVPSTEALQAIARSRYERASRVFSMLHQMLANVHQTIMGVISQIRSR